MNSANQTEMKKNHKDAPIGNVIRIIDQRTLIVNVGVDKLKVDDTIQVYELGEMLRDVDGNELDFFYHIKDELEVIQVEEHYSICKKTKAVTKVFNFAISPLLEQKMVEYTPLNIDKSDIQELMIKDPLIRIGDPIKLA